MVGNSTPHERTLLIKQKNPKDERFLSKQVRRTLINHNPHPYHPLGDAIVIPQGDDVVGSGAGADSAHK